MPQSPLNEMCRLQITEAAVRRRSVKTPATLSKKSLLHRCFPVNFTKSLRTPFFAEDLQWPLLPQHLLNSL